jgi:predicted MFS family arabinose efflux permease
MPLSSIVIMRLGEPRAVVVFSLLFALGTATIAVGVLTGIPLTAAGLFLLGFGNGTWDVAMNVQAAAVEQGLGRVIMSRFHAGFSIGTVLGAGLGAAMVALDVPVTAHLLGAAALIAAVVPISTRGFLAHAAPPEHAHQTSGSRALAAWHEPRTLLIGVFVLCMAFTEGTGNDWLSVGVIDGYHTAAALGTLTFALFLAAMTAGRWFGPTLIERHGRVHVLRASALLAIAGLLLVVFGATVVLAMVGAILWGAGTALGFPTGMSAASDDPGLAAARVSVAASVGYIAFLAGPPLIGFVGDHVGVLHGLTVTVGVLAVALLVSGAIAPLPPARDDTAR